MVEVKFKLRGPDGKWSTIPLEDSATLTLAEIALQYDGKDCVFEAKSDDGKVVYFCGTRQWIDHYQGKGFKAFTFPELAARKHVGIHAVSPLVAATLDTFGPGCTLEQISLF